MKLLAEVARIWLWVARREHALDRRETLLLAIRRLPEEEEAFRLALELQRALGRELDPQLGEVLPAFARLSGRVARELFDPLEAVGSVLVRMSWGGEAELALPADAREGLHQLPGVEPKLFPLTDWRAVVVPPAPDEAFALLPFGRTQPESIAAAAAAARTGCSGILRDGDLLIRPVRGGGGVLRSVQCSATDPVSFALLAGMEQADFPSAPGLSAADWARRATAEHRAWLHMTTDPASPALKALGRQFTAARAALFLESIEEGEPQLALTVAATRGAGLGRVGRRIGRWSRKRPASVVRLRRPRPAGDAGGRGCGGSCSDCPPTRWMRGERPSRRRCMRDRGDRRTRVLLLVKGMGRGGTQRLLVNAAPFLDRSRFDYEVAYLLPANSALVPELEAGGLEVSCLDGRRGVGWVGRLASLVRKRRIELVHAHSPYAAVGARLGISRTVRLVYTEHNVWASYRPATRCANALTYWRNDHVFAVSEAVRASIGLPRPLRRLARAPIETLYHGHGAPGADPTGTAGALRRDLGIPADAPLVRVVASFKPRRAIGIWSARPRSSNGRCRTCGSR